MLEPGDPSMPDVPRSLLRAWLIVAMLLVFMGINFADKIVLGLSAVPIMRDLHLTHLQFGAIGSSFFVFFSLSAVVLGIVANRVPTRWMLAGMTLLWSLAQSVPMMAASWPALIASRVMLGFGEGAAYPIALHSAYKWFPNSRRAFPTSLIALGGTIGVGVAAPALSYVIIGWSWRAAFAMLSLVGLAWCAAWLALGREGPLDTEVPPGGAQERQRVPYRALLVCPTIVGVQIVGFAAYWLVVLAVVWLPASLAARFGYSQVKIGWLMTLLTVFEIVSVPAICEFSERLSRRGVSSRIARARIAMTCVAAAGLSAALFAVLPGTVMPLVCMIVAFSIGDVVFVLGHVMVAEITPAGQRAAMLGVTNGLITLAGPLAPLVMGFVVDVGANPMAGFRSGFIAAGCFVAACSLIGLLLNPEADRRVLMSGGAAKPAMIG
jgi:ACS family D-galactonate transporter-like MFS transporter